MKRKTLLVLQASSVILLAVGLSACGGSGSYSPPAPTPTQTTTARVEDQFGIAFGNDFRADPNSEPSPVSDGDLVAVSLTAEPVPIN